MKKHTWVLMMIMLTVSVGLMACSPTDQQTDSNAASAQEAEGTRASEGTPEAPSGVNYEAYKGEWKLHVPDDSELYLITALENYFGATGISITHIDHDSAAGSMYSIQGAPSYRQAEVIFEGTIEDGKISASYEDEGWEYTGIMELTLENHMIVANIMRDEVEMVPMWGIPEGTFVFLRPIETEAIDLSDDEKSNLEQFLSPMTKEVIQPFDTGELTDEMIIHFVGVAIGGDFIDAREFGDQIVENAGEVMFEASVMDDLANRYFGTGIKEHRSYDLAAYENGIYTVFALGGVTEYPTIQVLMKDTVHEGTYYAIVDYRFEYIDDGSQLEYQYLMELYKEDNFIIKSIKEVLDPIDLDLIE